MIALVIESSSERSIAALFENGQITKVVELPVGLTSSKYLLKELHPLLIGKALDLIIAGQGPGSYTGIRVGAAIAKTLSFARQIPLVGVCSLEGFLPKSDGTFAAVIDAKISGVYIRYGSKDGDCITWEGDAEVLPLAEVRLPAQAITPYKAVLEQKLPGPQWIERYPDPDALYRAGLKKYAAGEFTLDGHLELNYLRQTIC